MITYGTRDFSNGKAVLLMADDYLELVFISTDNTLSGFHAEAPLNLDSDDEHFRRLMAFSAAETFDPNTLDGWTSGNDRFHLYSVTEDRWIG